LTVAALRTSAAAISVFQRPSAIRCRTSSSRGLNAKSSVGRAT
jgi:hypothetical protein